MHLLILTTTTVNGTTTRGPIDHLPSLDQLAEQIRERLRTAPAGTVRVQADIALCPVSAGL